MLWFMRDQDTTPPSERLDTGGKHEKMNGRFSLIFALGPGILLVVSAQSEHALARVDLRERLAWGTIIPIRHEAFWEFCDCNSKVRDSGGMQPRCHRALVHPCQRVLPRSILRIVLIYFAGLATNFVG